MALLGSKDETLLLHNPRCSKSRAALALLEERGESFRTRLYLEEPLTREELEDLKGRLARPVAEWTRTGEDPFKESGLDKDAGDAALIEAIEKHPILLQRPILVRGERAAIGRPQADAILELL